MSTAAQQRIPVEIEITSDSICPFCYIGYKRITEAIDRTKAKNLPLDFSIKMAPFELDPTLPTSPGLNKREMYRKKFGDASRIEAMEKAMAERGKGVGINFSYGGNVSNTRDSHRLIEKARSLKGEQGQLRFTERLFKTYFEEEGDVGSHELLARDAETAGIMTKDEALAFLKSDELKKEVDEGIKRAQMRGISGVPFTILNGKLAISGAQETDTFEQVFEQIASGELKA
ncbi:hypothetical protein OIV83_000822 [Microbotryomycetes sp. JL201]|nr:hypothetical protein OIV83_000822 [Microbotryomycetes sp. JL201]